MASCGAMGKVTSRKSASSSGISETASSEESGDSAVSVLATASGSAVSALSSLSVAQAVNRPRVITVVATAPTTRCADFIKSSLCWPKILGSCLLYKQETTSLSFTDDLWQ